MTNFMGVVIYGAGTLGLKLAQTLYFEGRDITVVDSIKSKIDTFQSKLDVLCIVGHIGDEDTIKHAKLRSADVFIAVTDSDEENIAACIIAKNQSVRKTIARLRNRTYFNPSFFNPKMVGIDHIINPEKEVALEISKLITIPWASEVDSIIRDMLSLFKMTVNGLDPKYLLSKLKILSKTSRIIIINVEQKSLRLFKKGDKLIEHDDIYILYRSKDLQIINKLFKDIYPPIKDVLIIGGGQTGSELLELLKGTRINRKLIEISRKRCSELNHKYKKSIILLGDGTNLDLLLQENISKTDCFVAATGDDETNIVLSLFAKQKGVKKVITKILKSYGDELLEEIGLQIPLEINNITANKILSYVSMKQLIEIISLHGNYEMLEFVVTEKAKINGKVLKDSNLCKGAIIGAIYRDFELLKSVKSEKIRVHDRIIVFSDRKKSFVVDSYFK